MGLFNLSVAAVDITAIWKNSIVITILKAGKPRDQGRSYLAALPSSENIRAAPPSVYHRGAVHTPLSSQLQTEPLHRLGHAPISARVVFGFNQCKPATRTIAIAVTSWRCSTQFLASSSLRWSTAPNSKTTWWCGLWYTSNRNILCLYQRHHLPSGQVLAGVSQGSVISPALFNHFVSDCPLLPRNPAWYYSLPTPTSPDSTLKCKLVTWWLRWTEPPKILGVTLDTHFTFGPYARDCVEQALRVLNVMKALADLNWVFMTKTLVATFKAIVSPILNYALPSGSPKFPQHTWDKLEVF